MGRESKSNNRPEPVDDGNSRLNIGGKIPAKVDPPSPFDLDQNQESNDMDSSKESLNNQLPEPQPLRLKQLGSQNNIDSEPEHKKSQLVGTPLNVTTMASRDKLFSKSLNSITEEIPAATSNLVNDLKHIEPLFVKSMKKATDSGSRIYYIFQLWSLGNTLCFIEKGQDDFEALRKALEHDRSDVPFLPEIRLYNLGATGNILQGWMKNVCNLYPDHQALIKFMNTSVIEQNDLRESFKKQGMLYKKGNYFGVWKARYYELDTATGNVYYSEQVNIPKLEKCGIHGELFIEICILWAVYTTSGRQTR